MFFSKSKAASSRIVFLLNAAVALEPLW